MQQFVAVTGSTSEVATNLIEACSGDLDMAINMHLECVGGAGVGGASAISSNKGSASSSIGGPSSSHNPAPLDTRDYKEM